MSATQDFVALDWIREEISRTLEQAQDALEAVAQTPDDTSSMRSCLTSIHQIHGTLQMVELAGPIQLAGEMEELAQALMNDSVPDVRNAQEVLMQSILQMSGHLDRIHREQQDRPEVVIPTVNNLRIARGLERLAIPGTEDDESAPDLHLLTTPPDNKTIEAFDEKKGSANVPRLRRRYQQALGSVIKRQNPKENLNLMAKVFLNLERLCGPSPVGYLSQIVVAVVEGIATGGIKFEARVLNTLKQVDKELKRLSEGGTAALSEPVSDEVAAALIDFVHRSTRETSRIKVLRELFSRRPVAAEEMVYVSSGPDEETMATVARILDDELTAIIDKLDLYVRSGERSQQDLVELLPMLEQISSTMSVVGLGTHQENIEHQLDVIRGIEQSGEVPDEETLLNLAGALLHIESLLHSMSGVTGDDSSESDDFGDLDQAQAAVIKETRNGLARCKDAVIEFISSGWDHANIETLPQELKVLRGGLQICNQERSANILLACAHYVTEKLLKDKGEPDLSEMEDLADAMTSVDYYLERLLESSSEPYLQMMEVAEAAITRLGLDVDLIVANERSVDDPLAEPQALEETDKTETEVDEAGAEQAQDDHQTTVDGIDDEVTEIFADEAAEVLETIKANLPRWRDNPADREALTEVRRAFHTLKGSGRMVGATVVGELAWSIENLLNNLLDKTVEPTNEILALVDEVVEKIPRGVETFTAGNQDAFEVEALIQRAQAYVTVPIDEVETELPEREDLALEEVGLAEVEPTITAEDAELNEIFVEEANECLECLREFVREPASVDWNLVAALHTIKGSASMAGIDTVARVAAPLEQLAGNAHSQGVVPGDALVSVMGEGLRLMEEVLGDLDNLKQQQAGIDEFLELADSLLQLDEASKKVFEFENIRYLADPAEILRTWDAARVEGLVDELRQVRDQAEALGYQDLVNLAGSMLGIYEQLVGEPTDEVVEMISLGHESLLLMLDEVASGQDITPADDVVARLDNIDPGVLDADRETQFFLRDCWQVMGNLDSAIQNWRQDMVNLKPLQQVGQHLSSLEMQAESRQASAMISLLEEMIRLCEALNAGELAPAEEDIKLLEQGRQALIEQLEQIKQQGDALLNQEVLAGFRNRTASEPTAAHTEEDTGAEPRAGVIDLPDDQVDEDVLPIFLEEADELLESIDQSIVDWGNDTGSTEYLDNLLRNLHTVKGSSRLAGLASLGEYTHNFETWLIGIQQNPPVLDDEFFSILNQRQDEIIRRVEIYKKLATRDASEAELKSLKSATEPGMKIKIPSDPATSVSPADTAEAAETQTQVEPEGQETKPKVSAEPSKGTQAPEVVRVSADLLDELISLVGESSITRSRVEQQISDFGDALEEMEQTINRIREQLRRLEIETESRQILVRGQGHVDRDSAFDELEMDRYTVLQEISRVLSESASDMLDLKDTLTDKSRDAETLLHQQARISTELQEGLTRTTMVPFARLIPRLRRIVRQVSQEIGKSVRFDAYNVEGELDRTVLERIVAPLEHMLRNAVDHGIESASERKAANKPAMGRISLRLSREGAFVVLKISDDGAGLDVNALRAKAIERGLMTKDSNLSDHDVMQFIMHAGLSTAKKVTQISGRGVGMDVVGSELKQLGGSIVIDSTRGVGTEFTVRLPFTVSINRALMVVVGEETYAVPLNTIEGIVRVSPYELEAYYQPDAPMFEYAGQPYKLSYLGKMLDKLETPNLEGQLAALPVLLARSGDNTQALQVDQVIGSREVVVKALGPRFNDVPGVSGATVLGDGSVVIILDVMALVRSGASVSRARPPAEQPEPEPAVRTVMIVDDSVTVRKVTSRLMERQGWEVITAKDGVEAVNHLQDTCPDVVLLDIEMPRMDGFEVLRSIRRDERLKDLPVIIITSRTGEKHKQQAMELGVSGYLGKPFQEANLLSTIEEVLAD